MPIHQNSECQIEKCSSTVQSEGRIGYGLIPANKRNDIADSGHFIGMEQTATFLNGTHGDNIGVVHVPYTF
jgi:hypothetical protein